MFDCPFCDEGKELPIDKNNIVEHLIVTIDDKGETHVHGPIENKQLIIEMIKVIAKEAQIDLEEQ